MKRISSKLYNSSPKEVFEYEGKRLGSSGPHAISDSKVKEVCDALKKNSNFSKLLTLKELPRKNSRNQYNRKLE